MQYDEFIDRVQVQADITHEEAERATEATLETLSERLTREERANLASQLPDKLKGFIFKRNETNRFQLDDFYNRVAARMDVRVSEAIGRTQAVISVLQEAVAPGQMASVREDLPEEYEELFTGEPYSPTSPSA